MIPHISFFMNTYMKETSSAMQKGGLLHLQKLSTHVSLHGNYILCMLTLYLICKFWGLPLQQQRYDVKIWANEDVII